MFVESFQKQLVLFVSPSLPLFGDRVGLANLERNAAARATFLALCHRQNAYQGTKHLGRVLDLHARVRPAALRTKHCCRHFLAKSCSKKVQTMSDVELMHQRQILQACSWTMQFRLTRQKSQTQLLPDTYSPWLHGLDSLPRGNTHFLCDGVPCPANSTLIVNRSNGISFCATES